jgi:hypothetical protein
VNMEKKDYLPGLVHDVKFRCPECDNFTIAYDPAASTRFSSTNQDDYEPNRTERKKLLSTDLVRCCRPTRTTNQYEHEQFCVVCEDHVNFKFHTSVISAAGAGPAPLFTPPSEGERRLTTAKISNHLSPVEPEQCEIMISFNDETGGEVAEILAHYLTSQGFLVFCTKVYCPINHGSWRDVTESGARNCRYYIALMTNGWQLSKECKFETDIVKNRLAKGEVTIIPVWFDSFDKEYDNQRGHYYKTSWSHFQAVFFKDSDWKERLVKLLRKLRI